GSVTVAVYPDGIIGSAPALSPCVADDAAGAGGGGDRGLSLPPGDLLPPQPVPHASRSALFCRSEGVRPHPVGSPTRRWPFTVCLCSLWRWTAPVSRRRICVDGGTPGTDDGGPDVAHASGTGPSCGALGVGDAAAESRHSRASRTTVTAADSV